MNTFALSMTSWVAFLGVMAIPKSGGLTERGVVHAIVIADFFPLSGSATVIMNVGCGPDSDMNAFFLHVVLIILTIVNQS